MEENREKMSLSSDEIKKILPHRYPMLMIDKITDMEPGKWAKGIKNCSSNEPFFQGHFPEKQLMPGVLMLEALAQTGACAILCEPENRGKLVVFGGVKNARFKAPVAPGDTLELFCELTDRRGPVGFGICEATVNGKTACKAEISFAITDI